MPQPPLKLLVSRGVLPKGAPIGAGQSGNVLHILFRQFKIEHGHVLHLPLTVRCLGDRHGTNLHMPAQHNLCRGFAQPFGNACYQLIRQDFATPANRLQPSVTIPCFWW